MKLHGTAVKKILQLVSNLSGFPDESRLKEALTELDFSTYDQKTGKRNSVIVLTEDLAKEANRK